MHYERFDCDVATRSPCPLSASYRDLCDAIPILKEFVYLIDGDRARLAWAERRREPGLAELYDKGAPHWVPGDIFSELTGSVSGTCKVYGSREKALEDLGLAWAKARPDGKRREKVDEAARAGGGGVEVVGVSP